MTKRLRRRVRGANFQTSPPVDFQAFTLARSSTSGEQWFTELGIPGPRDIPVSITRQSRVFARYPAGSGGTVYPVQTSQFKRRPDDSLIHCRGFFKLPASANYAAGTNVEIGYSDTQTVPSIPNWTTVLSGVAAEDWRVTASIWEPQVYAVAFNATPVAGDIFDVTLNNGGSARTYSYTFTTSDVTFGGSPYPMMFRNLAKRITQDASGAFQCYARESVKISPENTNHNIRDTFRGTYNSTASFTIGTEPGGTFANDKRPSVGSSAGSSFWGNATANILYIWPRRVAGNPPTCTVSGAYTRASGSTVSFYTNGSAVSTNAAIESLSTRADRVTWTASWASASATSDGDWEAGHQVHEQERRVAFKNGSTEHPHLLAYFRRRVDRDGNVIGRDVTVENTKMFAYIREYFADYEVFVSGVSVTSGQSMYQDKYHAAFTVWSWDDDTKKQACDAGDFMLARIITPWTRQTAHDNSTALLSWARGGDCNDAVYCSDPVATSARGGYAVADLNTPLWPAPQDYSRTGGARQEVGLFNSIEFRLWSSDVLATWDTFKSIADNGDGALGFHMREAANDGGTDFHWTPPHLYLGWQKTPGSPTWGMPVDPTTNNNVGFPQRYRLAPLHNVYQSTCSHHPAHVTWSAYMVKSKKRWLDAIEQRGWWTQAWSESGNNLGDPAPYSAGAPEHRRTYQVANGNRSFAWPLRDVCRASFVMHEGHPRRTYWRKAAQDQADNFWATAVRTWRGAHFSRSSTTPGAPNSANWPTCPVDMTAGAVLSVEPYWFHDSFKSAFVNMAACHGQDLNAADFSDAIEISTWQLDILKAAPDQVNQWYWFLGVTTLPIISDATWSGSAWTSSAKTVWTDSGSGLYTSYAVASANTAYLDANDNLLKNTVRKVQLEIDYVAGYIFPKQQQYSLLMLSRHHSDATTRANAEDYFDRIETSFRLTSELADGGDVDQPNLTASALTTIIGTATYAQWFMQDGVIDEANVVRWS